MTTVALTETYRHFQIIVEKNQIGRFHYKINNPHTTEPIRDWRSPEYASQLDAENAAKALVDTLPANSCRSLITAITSSDSTSDAIIEAILAGLYVIKLAETGEAEETERNGYTID